MSKEKISDYVIKKQGERLEECMRLCKMRSIDLARKGLTSSSYISAFVNGKRALPVNRAIEFAEIFSDHLHKKYTSEMKVHFSELYDDEKEEYKNCVDKDGYVTLTGTGWATINYQYLLCESDEMFNEPELIQKEKSYDYLCKQGIKAILHQHGYDMSVKNCPDLSIFQNIKWYHYKDILQDMFYNEELTNEIVNVSTGETLQLLPAELFQLLLDCNKAIISIVERKFEEQEWKASLNSLNRNYHQQAHDTE